MFTKPSPHHCAFPADPEKLGQRVAVGSVGNFPVALREFEAARDLALPSRHDFVQRSTVVVWQCLDFLTEVADKAAPRVAVFGHSRLRVFDECAYPIQWSQLLVAERSIELSAKRTHQTTFSTTSRPKSALLSK